MGSNPTLSAVMLLSDSGQSTGFSIQVHGFESRQEYVSLVCSRGVIGRSRQLEVLVLERAWGFESPRLHCDAPVV